MLTLLSPQLLPVYGQHRPFSARQIIVDKYRGLDVSIRFETDRPENVSFINATSGAVSSAYYKPEILVLTSTVLLNSSTYI